MNHTVVYRVLAAFICAMTIGCGAALPAACTAGRHVMVFLGEYAGGKALDIVVDKVTGKPQLEDIQRQLNSIELALSGKPENAAEVRTLKNSLHAGRSQHSDTGGLDYSASANRGVDCSGLVGKWHEEKKAGGGHYSGLQSKNTLVIPNPSAIQGLKDRLF